MASMSPATAGSIARPTRWRHRPHSLKPSSQLRPPHPMAGGNSGPTCAQARPCFMSPVANHPMSLPGRPSVTLPRVLELSADPSTVAQPGRPSWPVAAAFARVSVSIILDSMWFPVLPLPQTNCCWVAMLRVAIAPGSKPLRSTAQLLLLPVTLLPHTQTLM
jgi:hypothetical protein